MPAEGISGLSAKFERSDDGGTSYTEIANVFGLSGPSFSRDIIEITAYNSGGYRDKIGGLRDGGQVTFTLNFTRAGYEILKGDFDSDDPVDYQIVLPDTDSTTMKFTGLVTELPFDIPVDDRITIDVTIEISGEVTLEPVA